MTRDNNSTDPGTTIAFSGAAPGILIQRRSRRAGRPPTQTLPECPIRPFNLIAAGIRFLYFPLFVGPDDHRAVNYLHHNDFFSPPWKILPPRIPVALS
jgi:hypothetical protein